MTKITTTLGLKSSAELGFILPHEHVFVDLRTWDTPGYAQAEAGQVIQLMGPEIAKAQEAGAARSVWDGGRILIGRCPKPPISHW